MDGQKDMVAPLLDRGADIDKKGMSGRTPVGWAANGSKREVVEMLMERGANIELRDNDGRSPRRPRGQSQHGSCQLHPRNAHKKKIAADRPPRKRPRKTRPLRAQRLDELKKHKPPKLKLAYRPHGVALLFVRRIEKLAAG